MKTCLIVGNGRSLNDTPVALLEKYSTFGSNRVYLKFDPDFYACVNPLVIEQYAHEINQISSVKYIRAAMCHMVKGAIALPITSERKFFKNPLERCYEGYTVTFVLMQLAYHMGFERVGLVGVDHYYKHDGKPNELLKAEGCDPNHFDSDYFSGGAFWNAPDLEQSEKSYRMAKEAFEADGRKIVNLTPGSLLDVFERESWDKWL